MADKREDDAVLGAYFDDLRAEAPVPSQALLAAIAADAAREQPRPGPVAQAAPKPAGALSWWRDLPGRLALAGGLTAATLAGVWIGYNPPTSLDFLNISLLSTDGQLSAQMTLAFDSFYQFEG